jgi:nucleotide-binding universal stress UspA family protein
MFRKILCGTDFSPASRPAFRLAIALARKGRARLLISHVVPSVGILDIEASLLPRIGAEMETLMRRSAERRLAALVARARKSQVKAQALLLSGVANEALTRAAKRERADLLVIGTHGRSGVERALLGSVAAKVIGRAPCPVLTVGVRRRSA